VHGQRREKLRDLVFTHLQGMALPMEQDIALDPADVGLLRPYAVMPHADGLPHLVEQSRLVPLGSASHLGTALEWLRRSLEAPTFNPRPG
jgi:hypothetical protein